MRLELNLIEIFCCVYEEGSFSKAAIRLRCSQPTVSGHIKNLESYIGARLFDRLPRQIVPTRAGEILYRRGRSILIEKDAAFHELTKLLNRVAGPLHISSSTIPGEHLLPRVIAAFHSKVPGVTVHLKIADSAQVMDHVGGAQAEIGFLGAKVDSVALTFQQFAHDELALVVPNTDAWKDVKNVTLEQLRVLPFISRETGSGTRAAFEKRIQMNLDEFNLVACLGSTGAIREALRAGLGVSVISLMAVEPELDAGLLKTLEIKGIGQIRREFFAIVNKSLTLSPIAESFLDFAMDGYSREQRRA